MRRFHYDKSSIVNALKAIGVKEGDTLFSHVSLLNLGFCQSDPITSLIAAIKDVIGESGTFLTPAYTYSFCRNEIFNPLVSESEVGVFSNYLIKELNMQRSIDPLFSVVGFGKNIATLFDKLPPTSFGEDCLYERLHKLNAKVCNIGLSLFYLTPIHYLERKLKVPYRFDKEFSGIIEHDVTQKQNITWEYYVRQLCEASLPDCAPLELEGVKLGICKKQTLGLSNVHLVAMKEYFSLASKLIKIDPWFLAKGSNL
ncbi:MAG: aminoglycoside 3-N-acetyltransferase [Alteromonadaceae bacterium]|jgi:aminoglycoside 3-N-acetyltransferase